MNMVIILGINMYHFKNNYKAKQYQNKLKTVVFALGLTECDTSTLHAQDLGLLAGLAIISRC